MPGFDIDSYLRISLSDMLLVAISTLLLTAAGKVLFAGRSCGRRWMWP